VRGNIWTYPKVGSIVKLRSVGFFLLIASFLGVLLVNSSQILAGQAASSDLMFPRTPPPREHVPVHESCAKLEAPDLRYKMSGAYEAALVRDCLAQRGVSLTTRQLVHSPDTVQEINASDVLLNDPSTDATQATTQSETTIAVDPNTGTVCSAFNDSGEFGGTNAFTGFARSTDGGQSFVDRGPVPITGSGNGNAGDPPRWSGELRTTTST
jgi:hypothetical protein